MSDQMITDTTKGKSLNLFDYTEEDLLNSDPPVLTFYEILNCPVYASTNEVKKAYRKSSLKYHPDKTGRGDDDYVFLAVKAAHDTLMDHAKRQAYDSTVMPFDDSVPPTRDKLLLDPLLLYKDDDFYSLFGPVFERNLRFDARLRPDLSKGSVAATSNAKKANQKQHHHAHSPPTLGDAQTPMEQVHTFYEYWVRFDSWRDFSSQAADELQVENELENAESRYEKRWIQKEIDKRAKTLKRQEIQRIQSLVERAMDADPRLRLERQHQQQQKERAIAERLANQQRQQEEQHRALQIEAEQFELEKIRKQEEKVIREKEKKLLRKERQVLRKVASQRFLENNFKYGKWAGSYEFSQDLDFLCNSLTDIDALKQFNAEIQKTQDEGPQQTDATLNGNGSKSCKILDLIQNRIGQEEIIQKELEENARKIQEVKQQQQQQANATSENNTIKGPWTKDELSSLAKAIKKYPPGGGSRWEQISFFVNNVCKQQNPRSKEECIEKYNQIARDASTLSSGNVSTTTTMPATAVVTVAASSSTTTTSNSKSNGSEVTAASSSVSQTNGGSIAVPIEGNSQSKQQQQLDPPLHPAVVIACDYTLSGRETAVADAIEDVWTSEQDQQLQDALSKFPANMDKNERWTSIAKYVTGKSKKQCVNRFKTIREALQQKNNIKK
jgi:DnaJ homolog subfamily C member 2